MNFNKHFKLFGIILIILATLLSACMPANPVGTAPSVPIQNDSGIQTFGRVTGDPNIYTFTGEVLDFESHTEVHGSGSIIGYGGYISGRMNLWQDGKGLLLIKPTSISPSLDYVQKAILRGNPIIVKTTDLKAVVLPAGSTVELKCRNDIELITQLDSSETLDPFQAQTWELDYCRMSLPEVDMKGDLE